MTAGAPSFDIGFHNWGFVNTTKTLSTLVTGREFRYFLTLNDRYKLLGSLSHVENEKIAAILDSNASGSCYGMSLTSILNSYGLFDLQTIDASTS